VTSECARGGRCLIRGEPLRAGACTADEDIRSAAGDEDEFAAVVIKRLSVQATEKSLEPKPRDIEEPEPLVVGCPPQRAGGAVVEGDVDSVVADRVPNRIGQRFVLVLSVQPGRDLMIERLFNGGASSRQLDRVELLLVGEPLAEETVTLLDLVSRGITPDAEGLVKTTARRA